MFRWFYTPTKTRRSTPSGWDFPLPWSIGGVPQWIMGPTLRWWVWRKCYFCSVHSAGVQYCSLLQLDITTVSVHTAYNAIICVLFYTYTFACLSLSPSIYSFVNTLHSCMLHAFSSLSSLLFHQSWLYKKLWSEVEVLLLFCWLCILLSFHHRRKLLSEQEYSSYLLLVSFLTCLQLQHSSMYIFPV